MITVELAQEWNTNDISFLSKAETSDYSVLTLMNDERVNDDMCLYRVFDDQEHIASFVCRVDRYESGNEMVVVSAGVNRTPSKSLYALITPFVETVAKKCGCVCLRGHTENRGVGRLMRMAGWGLSEYVYRKDVL